MARLFNDDIDYVSIWYASSKYYRKWCST